MKKIFLLFVFVIFSGFTAFAQTETATKQPQKFPEGFKSDGCTFFPDGDYRDCCVEHDLEYFNGGSWKERWRSDKKLFKCVQSKPGFKHKIIAPIMWLGVRAFGVPFLPTPFRWGFGKNKAKPKTTR